MPTLRDLFAQPRQARDDAWVASFFATIVNALMTTTPEPVTQGPDGFPYFVLKLPPPGAPYDERTLARVLETCTDRGVGIVVEPTASGPEWVFDYGSLFSLRAYGTFMGDPADGDAPSGPSREVLAQDTKVGRRSQRRDAPRVVAPRPRALPRRSRGREDSIGILRPKRFRRS